MRGPATRVESPISAPVRRSTPAARFARVFAREVGYVQHVDMAAIQDLAETDDLTVHLQATPGAFVAPPICRSQWSTGEASTR